MAERDDIRLRDRVQSSRAPQQRARVTQVQNIDVGGLAKQASKKLNEVEKVKLKAEDLAITDYENRLRRESYVAQTRIANARGVDASDVATKETKRIQDLRDQLVNQLPGHLRAKAGVRYGTALLPLEKFSLLHVSKEFQAHGDSVRSEQVKLNTQLALRSMEDDQAFNQALDAVKQSTMRMSDEKGRDPKLQEVDGIQAQGEAVIGAMKSASQLGNSSLVNRLYEAHQDKFISSKQTIEAQTILKKAKDSETTVKASALVEQAFTQFSDADSIERYMRQEAENNDIFKEALPIMRSKLVRQDKENKIRREKDVARAVEYINGGGDLAKALQMVPNTDKDKIRKAYKNKVEGATIASEPEAVTGLIQLMNTDPETFMNRELTNLSARRGVDLSDVDYTRFKGYQDRLNNMKSGDTDKFKNMTPNSVKDIISIVSRDRGFEDSSTFQMEAQDVFDDLRDKYIKEGKTDFTEFRRDFRDNLMVRKFILDDEGLPITRSSTLEAIGSGEEVAGLSSRSQRLFSTDDLDDDDRERITTELEKQLGRKATSKELNDAVKRVLIRKLRLERFVP